MTRLAPDEYHVPVMLTECLDLLNIQPGGLYIDATLGGGGHTAGILNRFDGATGEVISFDADEMAIEHCQRRFANRAHDQPVLNFVHANFETISEYLSENRPEALIGGILFDLGVSSFQFDHHDRGFSFRMEGPLDMRFSPEGTTAADLLNSLSAEELMHMFRTYADEPSAKQLANGIVKQRVFAPFKVISDLKHLVVQTIPPQHQAKTMARLFQALRIAVNDELGRLSMTISACLPKLAIGGRIVVMSYHSGEDRIVKDLFRDHASAESEPRVKLLTKKPVSASKDELELNPRSRSARLRAAERIA